MILRVTVALAVVAAALLLFGRDLGRTRPLPATAVVTMNLLRGLSAVAVLVGHARGLFIRDFAELERPSLLWKAFYALTGLGHQAVIVFFILSGFLVGSTVLGQMADDRWAFGNYFGRRLARLYVVLVPGLLLTAAWDNLGMHLFGTEGLYGGAINARHLSMPDVTETGSLGHFAGNLAFLQHLFIAPFGSNGPLWSLPYEFWAYLLFPFLVQAARIGRSRITRGILAAFVATAIVVGGWKLGLYLGIWLFGAALALWWRQSPRIFARWLVLALWGAFSVGLVLDHVPRLHDTYADIVLGLTTSTLLAGVLTRGSAVTTRAGRWLERAADALAGFSYTLYVAHYPVLTFLFAGFMSGNRWVASIYSVAVILAISAALMLYAFCLARVTERHTERVRAALLSRA